jgi:hypothetical protein
MSQATTEIPARAFEISVTPKVASSEITETFATFKAGFDRARHLLSNKPLLRANRTRPLRTFVSSESESERSSRRLLIQRRMPSRSRIQEILTQRPDHDPWLDDEFDWRP